MKVAVITPTVGSDKLCSCIDSVQGQDYKDLTHYLFIDGVIHNKKVMDTLFTLGGRRPYETVSLSKNVGGNGWYGHRVYAACSFLVDADIIIYLDEDNWVDSDHVSSLVDVIKSGKDWAYSFRKICNRDGDILCLDDCESLGEWPIYMSMSDYHIDTSCFAILRRVAIQISPLWYNKWGADRIFFNGLRQHFPNFGGSYKYSLNYRLDGNPGSVNHEFFVEGNNINLERYKGVLPWKDKVINAK